MFENEKKMNLSELIDLDFLQELQDVFAQTTNIGSITVNDNGPITKPSNFTEFCIKYTRASELGSQRCNECDIRYGKIAAESGKPIIYTCHSGLTDFAVPIVVDGQHLGSILGGQVLTETPDESYFRGIAKELGINEDDYIAALKKVKIVPFETVKKAADLLYLVANTVSQIGNKNLELSKKTEMEGLHRSIIETIRSSLGINEVLSFICEETAKLFDVQRSVITVFNDADNYEKVTIKEEYQSSESLKGISSLDDFNKITEFWGHNLSKGGGVYAIDNIAESDTPDYFKKDYISLGVKSLIAVGISKDNDEWGTLILSEYNKYRRWTEDEKSLLKSISGQIYIAIKQAEMYNALKQNTANLNAFLNNLPFMAWLKDAKSRLLVVNKTFAKMFNSTVEDLLGKTDIDFSPSEFAEAYLKEDRLVIETRQSRSTVELIVAMDGKNKWHETIKSPVFDGKGNVVGTVGIAQDVTERKEAEIELLHRQEQIIKANERERLLGSIVTKAISTFNMKEVINFVVVETGKFLEADRCFFVEYDLDSNSSLPIEKYAEYLSSDEIKSHSTSQPDKASTESFVRIAGQKKIMIVDDITKIDLSESSKKMLIDDLSVKSYLIVPIYRGEKVYGSLVLHYVNNFRHFTQDETDVAKAVANQSAIVIHQSQLHLTIKNNEKYTRTIIESIKDALITIDVDLIIRSCNSSVESIWGYPMSEVVGKKLDLLLDHNCNSETIKLCLSSTELYGTKQNGVKFPVEVDVSDIDFEDEKLILLVIRDITERKKIEKMKNEFVSTVSHELRTPLTSIKGSLGLIVSGALGPLPDKIKNLVEVANNNCTRLTNLINDILDLEKIKAGKYEFKYEELEVNSVIEQSVILNQSYADQFGMKIKVIKSIDETFIKADKSRVLQIMSNLISNAVKFSNLGGEVTINTQINNDKVIVSVNDKGIGIPEESKHKIFQSFSQVDSSDTRSRGGTGLGLSICKLIIEKMGGEIGFDSLVGKGSTFFFVMPTIEPSLVKADDDELKDLSAEADVW